MSHLTEFRDPRPHQTRKLASPSTSPLHNPAFICYKQFTESSVWLAGQIFLQLSSPSGI